MHVALFQNVKWKYGECLLANQCNTFTGNVRRPRVLVLQLQKWRDLMTGAIDSNQFAVWALGIDTHRLLDLSTRLINVLCRVIQKSGSNSCRSCNSSSSILGVVIWTDTDLRLDVLLWPSVVLKDCKRNKNRRLHQPSEYIFRLKLWKIKSFNFKFKCSIVLIESRIGGG